MSSLIQKESYFLCYLVLSYLLLRASLVVRNFWYPVLSSRCILNMKRLVTLKYKQRKTSNASQESDLEAC